MTDETSLAVRVAALEVALVQTLALIANMIGNDQGASAFEAGRDIGNCLLRPFGPEPTGDLAEAVGHLAFRVLDAASDLDARERTGPGPG